MKLKLIYTRRKPIKILILIVLFLCLLTSSYAKKEDYNVLLIIIDTLRPDHLGCYGYPENISPAIDKIAKDSVIFENSFSNAGYTLPSTMSILTSLYPSSHGMFHIFKDKLPKRVQTLAEVLQAYEYKTAWFSTLKSPFLDIDIGFGRGFQDKVEFSLDPFFIREELLSRIEKNQKNKFLLAIDARQVSGFFWYLKSMVLRGISVQEQKILFDEIDKMERVLYDKIKELAKSGKPPFDDPKIIAEHAELFNGVFSTEKIGQIKVLFEGKNRHLLDDLTWNYRKSQMTKNVENVKAYIAAYDTAIQIVDENLIKPIYEQLKSSGVYDKTIIIITSDHGDAFGEHGFYAHGPLYPEINRVPLIIKMPYAKKVKITKELAQGIDILPTVLELVGIEKPYQAQGKSLVKLMAGKDVLGPNKYLFAESLGRKSIRSKEWKLEIPENGDGKKELFHLTVDPGEHKNVYSLEPKIAAKLEKELKAWHNSLPLYGENHPFDPGVDQAVQERIKKTGYF